MDIQISSSFLLDGLIEMPIAAMEEAQGLDPPDLQAGTHGRTPDLWPTRQETRLGQLAAVERKKIKL